METECRIDKNQNSNVVNNGSTEENPHLKSEHLTNNTSIVSDTEIQTVENPVPENNKSINETIKDIFMQNITSINPMNFNERNYNTQVNKTPSPDILK